MFLSKDLVMLEPNPNSFANKQMKCELCEMLNIKRCYGNKFESLNAYCVRLYAFVFENYSLFETGEFRERLHAQSAQVNSCSEMPEILDLLDFALGLRQLRICRKLQEVEGIA